MVVWSVKHWNSAGWQKSKKKVCWELNQRSFNLTIFCAILFSQPTSKTNKILFCQQSSIKFWNNFEIVKVRNFTEFDFRETQKIFHNFFNRLTMVGEISASVIQVRKPKWKSSRIHWHGKQMPSGWCEYLRWCSYQSYEWRRQKR